MRMDTAWGWIQHGDGWSMGMDGVSVIDGVLVIDGLLVIVGVWDLDEVWGVDGVRNIME